MLFNSLNFFIFFVFVYTIYSLSNFKWQNYILLLASYWFYGSWDWRFLSLIWISTLVDFYCGKRITQAKSATHKKSFLFLSIFVNLSILGLFKYFNFFIESFENLLANSPINLNWQTLNIILPVGISFYTFQTMSYTIDIYHKKIKPTKNFLNFAVFVAYFPQLMAGPIERAKHLLPQVENPRTLTLDKFYEGCYLILWGLFQKVVIADNLAKIVDPIFSAQAPYQGLSVLVALYAFSFQILCDFAGYSNIARGLSKCMGFDIMINFNLPYFATNPREFWQRWHISLSSWLRDYLYIPLGGNKFGNCKTYRNLMITMLLGGLWHGAAWTFVIWGAYHGLLLILYHIAKRDNYIKKTSHQSPFIFVFKVVFFFHLVCFGWLIFRSESIRQIIDMSYGLIFNWQNLNLIDFGIKLNKITPYILILFIVQLFQYLNNDLMVIFKSHFIIKSFFYYACIILIIIFGVTGGKEFIYFQF